MNIAAEEQQMQGALSAEEWEQVAVLATLCTTWAS